MGKKCCSITLFVLAVVFLGSGIALLTAIKPFVVKTMHNKLILTSEDSEIWDVFVDPASENVQFQRKFWFFNITNPEEVCNGAVPDLVEMGPYVYDQHKYKLKDSISWSNNKEEVSYKYADDFTFNAKDSVDSTTGRQLHENDVVLTYNLAFFGPAYRVANMDPTVMTKYNTPFQTLSTQMLNSYVLRTCITEDSVFATGVLQKGNVSARLWGMKEPLWVWLQGQAREQGVDFASPTIARLQWNHTLPAPDPVNITSGQRCPMWDNLSVCETTTNKLTTMKTGGGDYTKIGQVTSWAGHTDLPWWGEGCQNFSDSTDGTQFTPGISKSDRPKLFADIAYRPIELEYQEKSSVSGIDTLRFGFSIASLQSSDENPANKCYNQGKHGYFNLSAAAWAPLLVSKAHFLDADTNGVNFTTSNGAAKGFVPVRSNDDSYLDIEPNTGAPLAIRVRMQINYPVGPVPTNVEVAPVYTKTQPLLKTLVPIVLTEDAFHISASIEDKLKKNLHKMHLILTLSKVMGSLLIVGSGIALGVGVWMFKRYRKEVSEGTGFSLNADEYGALPTKQYT
eukprot:PhM_4_TR13642/c0_g1_i1/m.96768/K12384/SCARB2, LIMP2, CD36L2; lysosome membrane protein 2